MANRFGVALHPKDVRWAAAEAVSETVIAAVLLLHEHRVDEIVAKLTPSELEQVIKIVGRSPSCYPPGAYAALKAKRNLSPPPTESLPPNAKEQAGRIHRADHRSRMQTRTPSGLAYSAAERANYDYTTADRMTAGTFHHHIGCETGERRMHLGHVRRGVARHGEPQQTRPLRQVAAGLTGTRRLRHGTSHSSQALVPPSRCLGGALRTERPQLAIIRPAPAKR